MTDRPIIFSAPMVRALLDGRKTQTRRLVPQPPPECCINYMLGNESWIPKERRTPIRRTFEAWGGELHRKRPEGHLCGLFDIVPKQQIGDRLWVRETWQWAWKRYCCCPQGNEPSPCDDWNEGTGCRSDRTGVIYRADADAPCRWRSPIHMPRRLSRLTLVVTDVRVQRLQEISEADAWAEGITDGGCLSCGNPEPCGCKDPSPCARDSFAALWNSIHGPVAWDANPWVAAISFTVHQCNIDEVSP